MTSRERIIQARESIEDALLLAHEHMGNKAVLTKLYHAMMYCLFALLDIRDLAGMSHADVIERFEREHVQTGKVDRTVLEVIRRAYDLTHECDCEHMPVPTDEEIEPAMKAVGELISATETLLRGEMKVNESGAF